MWNAAIGKNLPIWKQGPVSATVRSPIGLLCSGIRGTRFYPTGGLHLNRPAPFRTSHCGWLLLAVLPVLAGCASFRFQGQPQLRAEASRLTMQAREALARGRASVARKLLNRSLECCPEDPQAMVLLAEADWAGGDPAEAIQSLTAAVEHSPQRADLRVRLGQVWLASGQPAEASRQAAAAIRIEPDSQAAWQLAGAVSESEGDQERALEAYQRSAACEGSDPAVILRIAALYQAQARYPQALCAIGLYHQRRRSEAPCPEGLLREGEILLAMEQPERAMERLGLATRQEDCRPESYLRLSQSQLLANRSAAALQTLVAARERWPAIGEFSSLIASLEEAGDQEDRTAIAAKN